MLDRKPEKYYKQNAAFINDQTPGLTLIGILLYIPYVIAKFVGLYLTPIGWLILLMRGAPISAKEFEKRINMQIESSAKQALGALGIVQEQVMAVNPLIFKGYTMRRTNNSDYYSKFKFYSKNNLWYASDYKVVVCFFSDTQVYVYQCMFSMIEPSVRETVSNFFYTDILTVEITHVSFTAGETTDSRSNIISDAILLPVKLLKRLMFKKGAPVYLSHFSLATLAGLGEGVTAYFSDSPEVRASINGMRNLILEKKDN